MNAAVVGDELLAAIFDDPDDDNARAVYGDWLLQRGNPHGELIALQLRALAGKRGAAARARVKMLLAAHRAKFLGPLHDIVLLRRLRIARGFLERCAVARAATKHAGNPWWSTVRELDGGAPELVLHPIMDRLHALVLYHPCLGELGAGRTRALRTLDIRLPLGNRPASWDADAAALGAGVALPQLRSLSIVVRDPWAGWRPSVADYEPIVTGALADRLERLRIECIHLPDNPAPSAGRSIGAWLAALRVLGVAVPTLELDDGIRSAPSIYRFERDPDGRHRLRSIEAHFRRDEIADLIQILCHQLRTLAPDDVAALAFRFVGRTLDAQSRALLHASAQRFPGVITTGL